MLQRVAAALAPNSTPPRNSISGAPDRAAARLSRRLPVQLSSPSMAAATKAGFASERRISSRAQSASLSQLVSTRTNRRLSTPS